MFKFIMMFRRTSKLNDIVEDTKQNAENAYHVGIGILFFTVVQTIITYSLVIPSSYNEIRTATAVVLNYEKRLTKLDEVLSYNTKELQINQCDIHLRTETVSSIASHIERCDLYLQSILPSFPNEPIELYSAIEKVFAAIKDAKRQLGVLEEYAAENKLADDTPFSKFPKYSDSSLGEFQQESLNFEITLLGEKTLLSYMAIYLVPLLLGLLGGNLAYLLYNIKIALNESPDKFKSVKLFGQIKSSLGIITPAFQIILIAITCNTLMSVFVLLPGTSLFINLEPLGGKVIFTINVIFNIILFVYACGVLNALNDGKKQQ